MATSRDCHCVCDGQNHGAAYIRGAGTAFVWEDMRGESITCVRCRQAHAIEVAGGGMRTYRCDDRLYSVDAYSATAER